MLDIVKFSQIAPAMADLVGGKGLSLGLTAAAGLPVPSGFCVTSKAYRRLVGSAIDSTLLDALFDAYRELGGGVVAVRSSATDEDGAETSFAGQQETILGVEGEAALREAVERCWRSLHSERAKAYREHQGVNEASVAMAVVVQRLIDADVAGVNVHEGPARCDWNTDADRIGLGHRRSGCVRTSHAGSISSGSNLGTASFARSRRKAGASHASR